MIAQLVKIDVAAADLDKSVKVLFEMADGGTLIERSLLWVFDFSNGASRKGDHRRDLRYWRPELLVRASQDVSKHNLYRGWELGWVITRILPVKRQNFHAGEVDKLFQLRPRTRLDFAEEMNGKLQAGRTFYERSVLVDFLTRRWLGKVGRAVESAPQEVVA